MLYNQRRLLKNTKDIILNHKKVSFRSLEAETDYLVPASGKGSNRTYGQTDRGKFAKLYFHSSLRTEKHTNNCGRSSEENYEFMMKLMEQKIFLTAQSDLPSQMV